MIKPEDRRNAIATLLAADEAFESLGFKVAILVADRIMASSSVQKACLAKLLVDCMSVKLAETSDALVDEILYQNKLRTV